MTAQTPAPKNILRLPAVIQKTGMSRSTIYAYMEKGKFPKSVTMGERSIGWLEAELDEYIDSRVALRG